MTLFVSRAVDALVLVGLAGFVGAFILLCLTTAIAVLIGVAL